MALTDNLIAAWDFSTGSGTTIADVISGIILTRVGATFASGGLLCDADGEHAVVLAPTALKIGGGALSFGFNCDILGAPPPNYASYMGCSYSDNPAENPYWAYVLYKNDSGHLAAAYNNAGTYGEHTTSTAPVTGEQNFLVVIANGRRAVYRNGTLMATAETATIAAPNYTSTSQFSVGDWVGGRNINTVFKQAYVWAGDRSSDAGAYNSDPIGAGWAFGGGGGLSAGLIKSLMEHSRQ